MFSELPSLEKVWEAIGNYGFYTRTPQDQEVEVRTLFPSLSEAEAKSIVLRFRSLFDFVTEVSLRPIDGDFLQIARKRCPGFSDEIYKKLLHYCDYMNNR